jgi:protein O-GlcNAc transferase
MMNERHIYLSCPLCDSPNINQQTVGNCATHHSYHPSLSPEITWMNCGGCSHSFAEGFYRQEALELIFKSTQEIQVVGKQTESQRFVSAKMIDKITPFVSSGRWLDVGFGNGSLLFTAQEYGFKVFGLDLREDSVRAIREFGVNAEKLDITEYSTQEKFDVVSLMDVLEHMPFPKLGLEAAHALLAPMGFLFLSMPNSDTQVWRDLDRLGLNPYWGELEHYHNFTRASLYRLLDDFGFRPVRYGISERYRVCMEVIAQKL